MPFLHIPVLLFVLVAVPGQDAPPKPDCRTWQECRQLGLDAATRQDFEAFHDLAWRAMQLGPKNDPALMYLLARAQSLSGRPGDALVMLERLAGLGVPLDAATNEDFRRVRALPRWPELERRLAGSAAAGPVTAPGDKSPVEGSPAERSRAERPAAWRPPVESPAAEVSKEDPASAAPSVARPVRPTPAAPVARPGLEPLRFTTPRFTPAGLGYDAVSRRFVVGDRDGRKLAVVDEFSQHVANLAGAQSSGFGEIAALEIDPREGDLWVVSSAGTGASLHKLQLISGRLLSTYAVPGHFGPVSFGDVAVARGGGVLALDTAGHRLFRLAPRAAAAEVAVVLPGTGPTSIAPAEEGVVYVASASGVMRADLGSGATVDVKTRKDVDLAGLTRIRWYRGALAAIQKTPEGYRAVRITLDPRGRTATALEVLDPAISISNPTAATVVNGVLYYLADGEGSDMAVRRVLLR